MYLFLVDKVNMGCLRLMEVLHKAALVCVVTLLPSPASGMETVGTVAIAALIFESLSAISLPGLSQHFV